MRGAALPFAYEYLRTPIGAAMTSKWIDKPTEVDFYRGITDNAPDAKSSAITYGAIVAGFLYGKKVKKKKK